MMVLSGYINIGNNIYCIYRMVISTYFDFYVLLTSSCLLFNLVPCTINKNTCVRIG